MLKKENGQFLLIDEQLNFDDFDVRKDPKTKEYIFSEQSFTELWAWLIFMENRVEDLKLELTDQKAATRDALDVSDGLLDQNKDLIGTLGRCEDSHIEVLMEASKLSRRPSSFQVALGGVAAFIVGTAAGIIIWEVTQ